jgi:hypothetical protein
VWEVPVVESCESVRKKASDCNEQVLAKMKKKSLKVDREQFEGIVKRLAETTPTKREDVKVDPKKPAKLIPPQK